MIKEIRNIPYLSKVALANYLDKNSNTLRNSISYWEKTGSIVRLKRGFYVFTNFLEKDNNSLYYSRFLATKMIEPSYLSMESVLQDYQMITDVAYGYSIITIKKTNSITNKFGSFNYQSIKEDLFSGFSIQSYGDMNWYVASKSKALFDYIYFNQNKFVEFSKDELSSMRLNLDEMKKIDWIEYKKYLKNSPTKMSKIYKIMESNYVNR